MKQAATTVPVFILFLLAGCSGSDPVEPEQATPPGLVEVTIESMDFIMPEEIPHGWTTFRTTNQSAMVHLGVVERMPAGYGLREQQDQIAPVFQDGMNLLIEGNTDGAMAKFGELPEWFGEIVFTGGPGLLSPGQVTETSVYLEPGAYILECYVKTDGVFHSYNPDPNMDGMITQFTVTEEPSGAPEPTPTLEITIGSETGMEITGNPTEGNHTVAVHFKDQSVHEHFLGHDVHLVRLTPETDLAELVAWMNWSLPAGLQTPAPVEFLGGTNELPAGGTAFFTVSLEPGDYAWIAEVPAADQKGMLQVFSVE
jgi:hypothetical protein